MQANHNLCVVHVERNNLAMAEVCLIYTLQLAPNEHYIQQHLAIVRSRMAQQQRLREVHEQRQRGEHQQNQQNQQQPGAAPLADDTTAAPPNGEL